jgi:p-hydroxybenzoate 3-monooxygenase
MHAEGLIHQGLEVLFAGKRHRIDLAGLTGGNSMMVYGQTEVTHDLMDARAAAGLATIYEAEGVSIRDFDGDAPVVRYRKDGQAHRIDCDYIAGCDGFHGVCRASVPAAAIRIYEKVYPFGWLGLLAEVPPVSDQLIYVNSERGFALCSMRSVKRSRYYLQCRPDENLAEWPDDRIWEELQRRFETSDGFRLNQGPILQKGVTAMRSFVTEPMQFGRLFLAGDAAHIVPPTGAKGLNLAVADLRILSRAIAGWYRSGATDLIDRYSEICLRRVWRAQHFSWWMTSLLHRFEDGDGFDYRRQLAELEHVTTSRAAATSLAENYTGLPFDLPGECS